MLFSTKEVAEYINAKFEPVWESIRPVPMVTIDFGNGHAIKRTLQGNIATYICSPGGSVIDVLPGIYSPTIYRLALEACEEFARSLHPTRAAQPATAEAGRFRDAPDLADRLRVYHTRRAAGLKGTTPTPPMQAIAQTGGGFKIGGGLGGFQGFGGGSQTAGANFQGAGGGLGGFKGAFGGYGNGGGFGGIEGPLARVIVGAPPPPSRSVVPPVPLAARPELVLDAQVNELIRRRTLHLRLAEMGIVRPEDIKKWVFKEVLHTDLDDPLLGLGKMLTENYPFIEEERTSPP